MGLGLPQDYFEGSRAGSAQSYWCTRVIHYPPLAEGTSHRQDPLICLGPSKLASVRFVLLIRNWKFATGKLLFSADKHSTVILQPLGTTQAHQRSIQYKDSCGFTKTAERSYVQLIAGRTH